MQPFETTTNRDRPRPQAGPRLPLPSALGLRLPAAAAPDEPLRPRPPGVLLRGAGLSTRASRRARHRERPARRHVAVPHLPRGLSTPRRPRRLSASSSTGCSRAHGITRLRPLVLHADGARLLRGLGRAAVGLRLHGRAVALPRRAAGAAASASAGCCERADLVFTGGQSLYEAKRERHPDVHAFPEQHRRRRTSAARAPAAAPSPPTRPRSRSPRLGYFGVIDERMDLELLGGRRRRAARLADRDDRPGGQDRSREPAAARRTSTSSGMKTYDELPSYLAGWDVALMPFARNESTRFISPTKTPEYLAGGRPVVSTPIRDVVRPYGELGLVRDRRRPRGLRRRGDRAMPRWRGGARARGLAAPGRRIPRPRAPGAARAGRWPT